MSERKVDAEIAHKLYPNDASLIDKAEIIDVSAFDFDDTDTWLCVPIGCQTESQVQDLFVWLRSVPVLPFSANRRSIDTRTFTRPKKRPIRTCFDSVFETLSPRMVNAWKTSCSDFSNIEEDLSKYSDMPTASKVDAVPHMLKVAPIANTSLLFDESMAPSGPESMELFFNMSHSKGNDSFINLAEPGVGDTLMNVSHPSIFYSSIISLPRDDSLHNEDCNDEPANLTRTRGQQADRHEHSKSLNINETFSKVESDDNNSYCLNPTDKVFTNKSYTIDKMELNETYSAEAAAKAILLANLDKDERGATTLSSTFVNKDDANRKSLLLENNEKKELYNLNATYLSTSQNVENPLVLDSTYSTMEVGKANKDTTMVIKPDTYKDKDRTCDPRKSTASNVAGNLIESSVPLPNSPFSFMHNNALDSTFKLPISLCNQSTPKNADALNSTFQTVKHLEHSRIYNTALSSNFKAPMSLRKELLAEIHRSGDHRLDCTFNHVGNDLQDGKAKEEIVDGAPNRNVRNDIPVENKYNTYKKEPSINRFKSEGEIVSEAGACVQNLQDKKYYTFTKKAIAHGGKSDMENTEPTESVDATFLKPPAKLQKTKQHIPRMLSKLPQFLQKSNPNLVTSSLKTINTTGCTNPSSVGYMKGSQPNIGRDVEKSLANKLYSLGKMKSGSEQRLLEFNPGVGELQLMGAGGSTESIESTQSAHSAPDLDDRLSTCSDSSHNSYTVQPMNIEQLHQIVRMQEESLKQDIQPPLNRRVLENTWVDIKKELPSPILKNGIGGCKREPNSPLNMDYSVKTSSPLLSPSRSNQSINSDGHPTENALKQENDVDIEKKDEVFNKTVVKVENKTKLRQPTNWNPGNRASNLTSAIPRPASRIPAPRLARTTIKNAQGDVKKGYM